MQAEFCPYIQGPCKLKGNALLCKSRPAIECHNERERNMAQKEEA